MKDTWILFKLITEVAEKQVRFYLSVFLHLMKKFGFLKTMKLFVFSLNKTLAIIQLFSLI